MPGIPTGRAQDVRPGEVLVTRRRENRLGRSGDDRRGHVVAGEPRGAVPPEAPGRACVADTPSRTETRRFVPDPAEKETPE